MYESNSKAIWSINSPDVFDYLGLELRDTSCKYIYSNGQEFSFMDEKTFEEVSIPKSVIKESTMNLLEEGMSVKLRFAQDKPVGVVLPRILKCTVAEILELNDGTDKK